MDAKSVEKRLLASAHITAAMNGIAVESVEEYDMAHVVHTLRAELTEAKEALRLCVDVVQHISYAWQGQGTHPQTAIKAALAAMEESK